MEALNIELDKLKLENASLKTQHEKEIFTMKLIEEALRDSDNLFRDFMDNLDAMIIIKDQDLKPVYFNKKMKEYFPTEGWLGKTPEETFPPEIAANMRKMDEEVFEKKYVEYEETWQDKRGKKRILFTRKFIINRDGKPANLGAIISDVTDQRNVEKALKESEEKYRTLVQFASDPIFSFNPDETYRFVNEAFARPFGKTPSEIIGKTPHDIFSYEEAEKRLRLVRHVFKTCERGEIEVKVVTVNGEEKYYITIVDPIKNSEGKIIWVNCISKEITERKKAEEEVKRKNDQLQKINRERDKFLSIIAHDLKSPLHGILGLTKLMATEIEDFTPEDISSLSKKIYSSTNNLYKLLENLLDWVRIQQGTFSYEPAICQLSGIINNNIQSIKDYAEQKGIKIINEVPFEQKIFGDTKMIDIVFRNLLSNAVKFSNEGGIIRIGINKKSNETLEVFVSDTGIGISLEEQEKLFKIEEKVGKIGTAGEDSTGLGLILVKEFVEKNGGKINFESKLGEGSTFYFTISSI